MFTSKCLELVLRTYRNVRASWQPTRHFYVYTGRINDVNSNQIRFSTTLTTGCIRLTLLAHDHTCVPCQVPTQHSGFNILKTTAHPHPHPPTHTHTPVPGFPRFLFVFLNDFYHLLFSSNPLLPVFLVGPAITSIYYSGILYWILLILSTIPALGGYNNRWLVYWYHINCLVASNQPSHLSIQSQLPTQAHIALNVALKLVGPRSFCLILYSYFVTLFSPLIISNSPHATTDQRSIPGY